MSLDQRMGTAAADLRRASQVDSDPEVMLRDLKRAHTRRRATGGALVTLMVVAILALGAVAWTSRGADRTLPITPAPTPTESAKSAPALAGCNLDCEWSHSGSGYSGPKPIPPGAYRTTWFFPGQLTMTFPGGWFVVEDTTGDLYLAPKSDAGDDASVGLWLDVTPVSGLRVPADGVANTPAAVAAWLAANPDVKVTPRPDVTLGSGLRATVVDVQVSKSAKNYAGDSCPSAACVYLFAMDGQWGSVQETDGPGETDSGWAIGRDVSYVRLYLVSVGGGDHTLYVMLDARSPQRRAALAEAVAPILASLELPAGTP